MLQTCRTPITIKNISSGNSLPWKTEFATFTGTMAAAFREMFDEKEYRLIDENKGMEVSEAINRGCRRL